MIYSYSELKGKIKVGDKVRTLDGHTDPYRKWSKERTVTDVGGSYFTVDNHEIYSFLFDSCLDLLPREITWDTLKAGDEVKDSNKVVNKVLGVVDQIVFLSSLSKKQVYGYTCTKYELEDDGYTIVQPHTEEPKKVDMTLTEIEEKLGHGVNIVEKK